ncbi:phosphoadenosine phosphosulfate reductase [Candidatus Hakubella thermalkaliphila]|uniref:Adenosine 5'-phosphosulfate reductase n=1 Tax=Candidatus Hakubella thermalkaliphila TaxID=2754717 RepID=A0A6V8Q9S2_9ACTN|nr:phosphoadenylyl-sulfate reductase [Candidatus Hakubella thermalkaliphila]GFP23198.1 phosphoadenosine phosphosulfate reductase [Candidatus Hakubella thermalkaliphila]GFP29513.1 phosphoadenosine phosphosulfate reductase [Candidatus Hakubella thermalkaliphila]GFP39725.1 phosphoadenosine phosphosulfate reductase [Candidatus Hakubella thermalkaliphila]GFP41519.1 phosphoadenosine phosphosulfate reductase [Candidatus Hakubella thermalkaliphila]
MGQFEEFADLEAKTAKEVLEWALKTYGDRVALASSFGAEDVVLIDMLARVDRRSRVFTLDTGRLPQETCDVMEKIRDKYGLKIEIYYPDTEAVEDMVAKYGPNLFYKNVELRKLCCEIRKVEPLKRALKELSAWITGLRREQSVTRTEVKKVEIDRSHNSIVKINPLADWSEEQVWSYIRENGVPYNALHDQNYPSIGCAPCTRAIKPGQDVRAGRWWWEDPEHKECGLHIKK